MTTDTETPIHRAGIAVGDEVRRQLREHVEGDAVIIPRAGFELDGDAIARAALTAALKVRWEVYTEQLSRGIDYEESILINNLCCGHVYHWVPRPGLGAETYHGWMLEHNSDDGVTVGYFLTLAEAKAAVAKVAIEAILGEPL